jgi:nicotinate-nucleotide pyrophosphorylase (carboxylating)
MIDKPHIKKRLLNALNEDAPFGDITSESLLSKNTLFTADIISKQHAIFFGEIILDVFQDIFTHSLTLTKHVKDSQKIAPSTRCASLYGNSHDILKIERVLLNTLQHLCGIATTTHTYVHTLNNPKIKIVDTRKTTPLWRDIEKAAVVAGGGFNHRTSLSDMILIKENHLKQWHKMPKKLDERLAKTKHTHPTLKIEIEIESLTQLQTLILTHIDYILLDNFPAKDLDKAIKLCQDLHPHTQIEVSGNITLKDLPLLRNKAIHRISCGSLTHSVSACDLSLLVQ